jgi:hypothetical protein
MPSENRQSVIIQSNSPEVNSPLVGELSATFQYLLEKMYFTAIYAWWQEEISNLG